MSTCFRVGGCGQVGRVCVLEDVKADREVAGEKYAAVVGLNCGISTERMTLVSRGDLLDLPR